MMKSIATAAALAIATTGAANAAIDLTGGPSEGPSLTFTNVLGDIDLTVTPTNAGTLGDTVTQNGDGLGVGGVICVPFFGCIDTDSNNELDTTGLLLPELLTFTFSAPVKLGSVEFSLFDDTDDYRISIDGSEIAGNPYEDNPFLFGWEEATSFSVGVLFGDDVGDFPVLTDSFRVKSITVAAVPVPAAGLMLVGALGGMAAYRRRQKKAA